jgi:hypothetical protein
MKTRKFLLVLALLSLFMLGIASVGAQDTTTQPGLMGRGGRQPGAIRQVVNIVADETGLQPRDILMQLRDGLTLADVITANGGSVDQVIADSVAQLTANINQAVTDGKMTQERADQALSNLQDVVTRGINGELFPNRLDRGAVRGSAQRILVDTVADSTGLTAPQILQETRGGSTLAEVITANGGDVDAVVSSAVASATAQINAAVTEGRLGQEQADQLLTNLPDLYTAAVNGELRQNHLENRVGRGVLGLAAEQTGLDRQEIVQQIRDGKSLADILAEHNIEVAAFIDSAVTQAQERLTNAVTNGRITQEQADSLIQTFRERLTERISQSPESTPAI